MTLGWASAEPDTYLVSRSIVDEGQPGLPRRRGRAIDLDARDPARHAVRILDPHLVEGCVIAERDREALPGARNARVDEERRPAQAEAQKPLDARPIHPARRARVPGPAASPRVRVLGVHVAGDHVGLDPIAIEPGARARVVDGVQEREELARPVAVAQRGERHDRPDGRVGVLAAVLPDTWRVALDVARVPRGALEGRREELDDGLLAMHEIFLDR